jgi:GNAT superfamily N-acetyltransferase
MKRVSLARHILPGRFVLRRGAPSDYHSLAHLHYRQRPPATWAAVWVVVYLADGREQVVAVGVLSYPVPMLRARIDRFQLDVRRYGDCLRFANENVRTISRVVVRPEFRALGLASVVVRALIRSATTPFVECSASMGRFTCFLRRAGLRPVPRPSTEPAYFISARRSPAQIERARL